MSYALKLFDTELLKFDVIENLADPVVHILWLDESKKELLPLGMDATDKGLASWLKHRSIPKTEHMLIVFWQMWFECQSSDGRYISM